MRFRIPRAMGLIHGSSMDEIIFEVHEDEIDGGFVATTPGHSIATQGDTIDIILNDNPGLAFETALGIFLS